ncbi:MAG: sulfite exporter TauE/SafE family protein [Clostridia bacterium]|nr:sulfite exporter TauE/SafE family protein [Clostridia bacterium]
MAAVYFIIVLVATTAGALAGVGGGVIIKPALDALGHFDIETIGILSSASVLSMAVVTTVKRVSGGLKISKKVIVLSLGAIAGGIAGKELFYLLVGVAGDSALKIIQSIFIIILMIIILFKNRIPRVCLDRIPIVFIVGAVLGMISSFLGIGGGPVNVAVLYILLNMNMKDSAVSSIFIILLAQSSKLAAVAVDMGFSQYNLTMLWYMIPAGIVGGIAGMLIHSRISEKKLSLVFDATVVIVILLCVYNVYDAISFLASS